jgi:hypothetical protein
VWGGVHFREKSIVSACFETERARKKRKEKTERRRKRTRKRLGKVR